MGLSGIGIASDASCPPPPDPAHWNGQAPLRYDRDIETCRVFAYEGFLEPIGYIYGWHEKSSLDLQYLANAGWKIELVDRMMAGERVEVVELFNSILEHYFLALPEELHAIELGQAGPGWSRTGHGFNARRYVDAPAVLSAAVMRFYGSIAPGPNSHFFTVNPAEGLFLVNLAKATPASEPRWNYEGPVFRAFAMDEMGTCANGRLPVWRAYNGGPMRGLESNHRFSTDRSVLDQMLRVGWMDEGVAFCADAEL